MPDFSCNPRRLPLLVKSCIPDATPPPPPANHRRLQPSAAAAAGSPILSLPDHLLLECLARAHPSSLPAISASCRRFSALIDSPSFLSVRRRRRLISRSLHALTIPIPSSSSIFTVSIPFPPFTSFAAAAASDLDLPAGIPTGTLTGAVAVPLGRQIYLIGRGSTIRFDTFTGSVAAGAPTLSPRRRFAAAAVAGRIYVAGGGSAAVEEYDPATGSWRAVATAPRRRYGCFGAAAGGAFFVIGGLTVGERMAWSGTMDAFEVRSATWRRGLAVPGGGCVVGACGAGDQVYVLASHATELSFWRWSKERQRGGEWERLVAPPGIGLAVRFCCVAVGEEKIVALAHAARRGRRGGGGAGVRGWTEGGALIVYDIVAGRWSGGPEVPPGFGRAALACVEW